MIWRAKGGDPVDIQVSLDNEGLAWFVLASMTAAGSQSDLKRTDHDDADGDAMFQVTPSEDLILKLRILGANIGTNGSNAWLKILQNGKIISCQDAAGKIVNKLGSAFGPVKLGSVAQAQTNRFNFEVWP
ncbi:MAG: hypothetical protein CGW95_12740 [Phenylobacterium zucineum]|nr:MAG: hypothetical protein CGW95_12740 [Phenylobacterium zucineum]